MQAGNRDDLIWAAGLFEGEGSVRITAPSKKRRYGFLVVFIGNTDQEVIDFFQTRWPAYTGRKDMSGTASKDQNRWIVAAQKAAVFLTDIQPYLRRSLVKERVATGLNFQKLKIRGRPKYDQTNIKEQQELYKKLKELNRRGR